MTTQPSKKSKKKAPLHKIFLPILGLLLLTVFGLWLIQIKMSHSPNNTWSVGEIQVGQTLQDFTLTQLDEKEIEVSSIKKKVVLINFWASWCEACVEEIPALVKLRDLYKDKGFEILGINLDENPKAVVPKIVQSLKIGFPIFTDREGKMADLFNVRAIPLTVIINQDRKILFVKDGQEEWTSPIFREQVEQWLME